MKVHLALILASSLLPMACGQISTQDIEAAKDALSSISSDDQAANDLYLDDTVDSAADESSSSSDTETSAEEEEVKDDVKAERLAQMAAILMERLDADSSGSLSLEEFLVGPEKRAEETDADDEVLAKIKAKMTEDFNSYAGDDALLSSEELQALLKAVAPRVGRHRHENFPGKQEERVEKSASDLISEYDKDGDGKLDASELEALQSAKKSEMEKFRKEHGPNRGGKNESGEKEGSESDDGESEGE